MPKCCVSASVSVRMSTPASASRRHGRDQLPGLVLEKQRKLLDFHWSPAVIDHALGLAFAALDGVRLDQRTSTRMPRMCSSACTSLLVQLLQGADLVAEDLRRHLHLHLHLVQPLLAGQDDLVVRQRALHRQQRGLDLRREHVDAADDQHVVAAPADAADAPQGAPAGARLRHEGGDVARAVADHRHGLLAERGQHQFAFFAVGQAPRRSPGR